MTQSWGGDSGPNTQARRASFEAFEQAKADSPTELPQIDFATFVLSLTHSALVALGDAPDPQVGGTRVELPMARQTIDLIALLQEKSRGNLTGEEERILDQSLYDLRMRYVEVTRGA